MLRAMIVDDEAPARSELRFLLEQTGKIGTITEASSVRSAIEMLMESRVDVVFLDISMPGASGLQLAEALHKLKNPPAIVFVTAYSDLRDTEKIPVKEDIYEYFLREVRPYVEDAWINLPPTKIGCEISFTKYFYKPVPLRTLEENEADILAIDQENDGFIRQLLSKEG